MPNPERLPHASTVIRRRTFASATSLVTVMLLVLLLTPKVREWRARETEIDGAQKRLRELAGVVQHQLALDSIVAGYEQLLSTRSQRVLRARSRALATSALQSFVQEMAEASNVTVTRLDVASSASVGDIPISLSANGDIFGLAELLRQLRSARYVVIVDKLQIQNNSALRGAPDVLQVALSMHAPVIVQ